jgi:alpha-galactosidase
MASVRIGIIGAGSAQFSAGIVRDLCVCKGLEGSHIAFMDVDTQRLGMIEGLARRLTQEIGARLTFSSTTDMTEVVKGADFIINTAQAGGHSWSEAQRSMAEKHGYYRGAHLDQLNQMAFFMDVAATIKQYAPGAWLIESANPVFEGCTLMHREFGIKVLGLCHGHYGYREIANVLGLEREHTSANMIGFNHWIWMTDFRYKGQDAYPLIDEWIEKESERYWATHIPEFHDNQMSRGAVEQYKLYGLFPIGDTPRFGAWWQNDSLASKKKAFGERLGGFDSLEGWQLYLDKMSENVRLIETVVTNEQAKVTDVFKPVQSDEQIVPIINALVNDVPGIYQVNIPNRGQIIKGFPEDLVIECRGVVDGKGISGIMEPALPEKIIAGVMIPRWAEAESRILAVKTGDYNAFKSMLLQDRRTLKPEQADALLDEWLSDPRNVYIQKRMNRN